MSKKIAHLGTVTLDTKLSTSKQLNADKILTNSEDVAEMFSREHTYREMTSRVKLQPEDNYILYGDDGKVVSANLSGVTNGTRLFFNQSKLTEIPLSWKLDSITDGTSMCESCSNLTTFSFPLTSLSNGSNMFYSCNLNEESVENILTTIPEYTSGSHTLTMYINVEAVVKFNEITGNSLPLSATAQIVPYKGWEIAVIVMGLPSNYKVVQYLEAINEPYIDSLVYFTNESSIEVVADVTDNGAQYQCFYGYLQNGHEVSTVFYANRNDFAMTRGTEALSFNKLEGKHSYLLSKKYARMDENIQKYMLDLPEKSKYTLLLCKVRNTEGNIIAPANLRAKIYSIIFKEGENKVFQFVPCVNDIGDPCFYDVVRKQSFTSLGSKDFVVPPEAVTYSLRKPVAAFAQKTPHGIRRLYHTPEGYEGSEEDYAQEFGFKQLVENERPNEGSWRPEWVETDNELILNWIEVEEEMTDV